MLRLKEIRKVRDQGKFAKHKIGEADWLILEVMYFAKRNVFMSLLHLLFRKKFDEQYNKLKEIRRLLLKAESALHDQETLHEDLEHNIKVDIWEKTKEWPCA